MGTKTGKLPRALLTLALLLVLASAMTAGAKAAWATEVWVAGSSEDNGSGATKLSLSNIGQQIHYTRSDGVQQAAWLEKTDGKTILCLSNYQVHSNAGRFHNNSTALAGIYCDGDLEIQVYGDCAFRAKNYSKTYCYGIYVLGNLTIVNRTTYDGSLTLEMGESATTTGEGIRCDNGTLTLKTQNSKSLTVTAVGCPATYSRGVFARTVVMNGGKLIAQGESQGIYVTEGNNSVSVPTYYAGANFDGSDKQLQRDVSFVNYKYSELDADTVGVEMAGWTYGGTASDPVYTSYVTGGTPTVRYSGTTFGGVSYSSSPTRPTKAGNYTVIVSYSSPRSVQGSATFTIARKNVSVSNVQIKSKEYDGNTSATVQSAGTLSGVKSGDTVSVTSGTAEFANKNVGTSKNVTCTGWTLTGTDKDNYTLSAQPTAKASITAKSVTVTGVMATGRTYEPGNTTVALTGGTISDKASGDSVSVSLSNAVGRMADDAAGTNKPVTVTGVALTGTDKGNYTLSAQPSGIVVTIGKAKNPITASSATVTTGGTLDLSTAINGAQGSVIYAITGEPLGCSVSGSMLMAGNTAGTVTATAVAIGSDNYESGTATIRVTVTAEPVAAASVAATVEGTRLRWSATLPGTSGSVTAIAVWYDADGRMLGCATDTLTANGAASGELEVAADAAWYKLMIVDVATYAPLCAAWDSTEK